MRFMSPHRPRCRGPLLSALLVSGLLLPGLLLPGTARAASAILVHNTDDTSPTSAVCLAAPSRETGTVEVTRIRITTSSSSPMSYSFHHKRTSDYVLDTEAVDPMNCSLPRCRIVIAVEGVVAGQVMELDGLSLVLPPGHRFYVASDSDIGSAYQTIEVYYHQR